MSSCCLYTVPLATQSLLEKYLDLVQKMYFTFLHKLAWLQEQRTPINLTWELPLAWSYRSGSIMQPNCIMQLQCNTLSLDAA